MFVFFKWLHIYVYQVLNHFFFGNSFDTEYLMQKLNICIQFFFIEIKPCIKRLAKQITLSRISYAHMVKLSNR